MTAVRLSLPCRKCFGLLLSRLVVGKVGSFEPDYEFDALVINDDVLHPDEYSLLERLERFICVGDDRQIAHRFCRGKEIIL